MAALARLRGVKAFIASVFTSARIIQTSLYFLSLGTFRNCLQSLVLSILSAVFWKSYLWTVVCSLFQVCVFWSSTTDGDVNSFCAGIVSCGFTNHSALLHCRVVIISAAVLCSQGVVDRVEVPMSLNCL